MFISRPIPTEGAERKPSCSPLALHVSCQHLKLPSFAFRLELFAMARDNDDDDAVSDEPLSKRRKDRDVDDDDDRPSKKRSRDDDDDRPRKKDDIAVKEVKSMPWRLTLAVFLSVGWGLVLLHSF